MSQKIKVEARGFRKIKSRHFLDWECLLSCWSRRNRLAFAAVAASEAKDTVAVSVRAGPLGTAATERYLVSDYLALAEVVNGRFHADEFLTCGWPKLSDGVPAQLVGDPFRKAIGRQNSLLGPIIRSEDRTPS